MGRYQTGNGVASSGEYKVVLESSWGTGSFPRRTGLSESEAACHHFFLNSSVLTVGLGARLEKVLLMPPSHHPWARHLTWNVTFCFLNQVSVHSSRWS